MKLQEKDYKTLKGSRLFKGIKEIDMEEALKILGASFGEYERGDMLHPAGEPVKKFGMVLSGSVNVCTDDLGGSHMIMAGVGPGNTFGEALCYLKVKEPVMYAEAAEDVQLLWLSHNKLFRSAKPDSAVAEKLHKNFVALLAERMLAMNDRIQVLSKITLREKLNTYFSEMTLKTGSSTFNVPFNREDMATYLGTNRSALSRELGAMKAEGLIDFYKNSFRILK